MSPVPNNRDHDGDGSAHALELRTSPASKLHERPVSMRSGTTFPPPAPDPGDYLVLFSGPGDADHPFNWNFALKLNISLLVNLGTFTSSISSAIFAPGTGDAAKRFGVGLGVGTLGTTLYVLGFAAGPLIWAPASELIGRRWPLTLGMLGGALFTIASAIAEDAQSLIICRFFAGVFGASQLSVVPAVLSDIYDDTHRGTAIAIYSFSVFVGPFLAPSIGGFICSSHLGWRWTLYIPALMSSICGTLFLLFLKETFAPVLLASKAAAIRRQTSNWAVHAEHERIEVDWQELIKKYFARPIRMLITEPIILSISLYMSYIYGIVYALLEAYPYVFETSYGMEPGVAGLTFLGLVLGQVLACVFILCQNSAYNKKLVANNNVKVPEWRLFPAICGAPAFTTGILWFCWTSFSGTIHWIVPSIAGVLIGFGVLCIFLPCFNYLVDAYLTLAASTVAANIILRSTVAASFPLFSKQMFQNLGIQWAGTLLGCLSAIMIPMPLLFRIYGSYLRKKSELAR